MEKMKGVAIAIILWVGLISLANANVTMDVDKWNGPSGTYVCKDVETCWMLYRAADARGDTYYCNSVSIKREGKIVWYRNFYNQKSDYDFPSIGRR